MPRADGIRVCVCAAYRIVKDSIWPVLWRRKGLDWLSRGNQVFDRSLKPSRNTSASGLSRRLPRVPHRPTDIPRSRGIRRGRCVGNKPNRGISRSVLH